MAHLLRGKQAGIHGDLSAGIGPDLFVLDHVRALIHAPLGMRASPEEADI
jgi:hypothetical protein